MKAFRLSLLTLILTLLLPSLAIASGQGTISAEEALEKVHSQVDIPKDFILLAQIKSVNPPELWYLSFGEGGKTQKTLEVRLDGEEGRVIYYSISERETPVGKEVSRNDAMVVALNFMQGTFSTVEFKQWFLIPNPYDYRDKSRHQFRFRRSVNGYPFLVDLAEITVINGQVYRFNLTWTKEKPSIPEQDIMEPAEASQIFYNQEGIELGYVQVKDPEGLTGFESQLVLAFYPRLNRGYIDPSTRKVYQEWGNPYVDRSQISGPMGPPMDLVIQPKNLDQPSAQKIAEAFVSPPSNYKLLSSSSYRDLWEFRYGVDNMRTEGYDIAVDRKTGEIKSYYKVEAPDKEKQGKITRIQAKERALAYIKKTLPNRLHQLADIKDFTSDSQLLSDRHQFYFPMIINGLPLRSCGVTVNVDGEGQVTSHEARLWSGPVPTAKATISEDEAKKIFDRRLLKPLTYVKTSHKDPFLAYRIGELYGSAISLEASTGDIINYDGRFPQEEELVLANENHWAAKELRRLVAMDVVNPPYDSFEPKALVTRLDFVKFLARSLRINPLYPEVPRFSDVSRSTYYYGYVEAMADKNIVLGSAGQFKPNANITREEIAVILSRVLGDKAQDPAEEISFKDARKVSPWAKEGVEKALRQGLIKGDTKGNFNPKSNITSAELVVLLSRLIDQI